eukprot:evm.model.scf_1482.3 EVM.evm.TU.scf_1482.3   scf_1482:22877-31866(-)
MKVKKPKLLKKLTSKLTGKKGKGEGGKDGEGGSPTGRPNLGTISEAGSSRFGGLSFNSRRGTTGDDGRPKTARLPSHEGAFPLKSAHSGSSGPSPYRAPSPSFSQSSGLHERGATIAYGDSSGSMGWPGSLARRSTSQGTDLIPPPFPTKPAGHLRGEVNVDSGPWGPFVGSATANLAAQFLTSQELEEQGWGARGGQGVFASELVGSQRVGSRAPAGFLQAAPHAAASSKGFAVAWPENGTGEWKGHEAGSTTLSIGTQEVETPVSQVAPLQEDWFQVKEFRKMSDGFEDDAPPWETGDSAEYQRGITAPPVSFQPCVDAVDDGFGDDAPPWATDRAKSLGADMAVRAEFEAASTAAAAAAPSGDVQRHDWFEAGKDGQGRADKFVDDAKSWNGSETTRDPNQNLSSDGAGAVLGPSGLMANDATPSRQQAGAGTNTLEWNGEASEVPDSGLRFEDDAPPWGNVGLPAASPANVEMITSEQLNPQSESSNVGSVLADAPPQWASGGLPSLNPVSVESPSEVASAVQPVREPLSPTGWQSFDHNFSNEAPAAGARELGGEVPWGLGATDNVLATESSISQQGTGRDGNCAESSQRLAPSSSDDQFFEAEGIVVEGGDAVPYSPEGPGAPSLSQSKQTSKLEKDGDQDAQQGKSSMGICASPIALDVGSAVSVGDQAGTSPPDAEVVAEIPDPAGSVSSSGPTGPLDQRHSNALDGKISLDSASFLTKLQPDGPSLNSNLTKTGSLDSEPSAEIWRSCSATDMEGVGLDEKEPTKGSSETMVPLPESSSLNRGTAVNQAPKGPGVDALQKEAMDDLALHGPNWEGEKVEAVPSDHKAFPDTSAVQPTMAVPNRDSSDVSSLLTADRWSSGQEGFVDSHQFLPPSELVNRDAFATPPTPAGTTAVRPEATDPNADHRGSSREDDAEGGGADAGEWPLPLAPAAAGPDDPAPGSQQGLLDVAGAVEAASPDLQPSASTTAATTGEPAAAAVPMAAGAEASSEEPAPQGEARCAAVSADGGVANPSQVAPASATGAPHQATDIAPSSLPRPDDAQALLQSGDQQLPRTGSAPDVAASPKSPREGPAGASFAETWFGQQPSSDDPLSPTSAATDRSADADNRSAMADDSYPVDGSLDAGPPSFSAAQLRVLIPELDERMRQGAVFQPVPEDRPLEDASGPATWEAFGQQPAANLVSPTNPWGAPPMVSPTNPWVEDDALMRFDAPPPTPQASGVEAALVDAGMPLLTVVETVSARFAGECLTRYGIHGRVALKLAQPPKVAENGGRGSEKGGLDEFRLVLRMKCVQRNVDTGSLRANGALLEEPGRERAKAGDVRCSLSMNEARVGIVESRQLAWGLGKCVRGAAAAGEGGRAREVELLRYTIRPQALAGAPLHIHVQWRRPRRAGQRLLVDIALSANPKLTICLWGVIVTLRGMPQLVLRPNGQPEGESQPRADWNREENAFQWRLAGIDPEEPPRHLRLAVAESWDRPGPNSSQSLSRDDSPPTLCAEVRFVMPHTTLSRTIVEAAVEPKYSDGSAAKNLLWEKMSLSGDYAADTRYD